MFNAEVLVLVQLKLAISSSGQSELNSVSPNIWTIHLTPKLYLYFFNQKHLNKLKHEMINPAENCFASAVVPLWHHHLSFKLKTHKKQNICV